MDAEPISPEPVSASDAYLLRRVHVSTVQDDFHIAERYSKVALAGITLQARLRLSAKRVRHEVRIFVAEPADHVASSLIGTRSIS
jgi:hypothetical protein